MGGEYWDADFHSDEAPVRQSGTWQVTLAPHSVRLSHLSRIDGSPGILDSEWAVLAVEATIDGLDVSLHGDAQRGLLVVWSGYDEPKIVETNIPASIETVAEGVYRVVPNLSEDRLQDWVMSLR